MPRIRKKTSRRGTTAQRVRIKHKATESRKKAKKAAKKDVTWKSKKSKDPGIPNNFPYKDQILAEIAEERRQVRPSLSLCMLKK
ncbi:GNL3L/Grn1 putative GTPase-domain-containing protein [Lactarius quietus]|nr:GNL3L/Grn1 putative GTPase-domain-containing protein [Lactarius quietus]